jgi:peptidoglycan/xylan/chitin deacetylase (PgdA/CDA1 family)
MYHRVASPRRDPQLLCVSAPHFAEHLEVLRRYWRPVSLAQLVGELKAREIRPRTVCVTFDDGYADNAEAAAPLLRGHGIQWTVFVVTGPIASSRRYLWYDELEELVLGQSSLPVEINIRIRDNESAFFPLGGAAGDDKWNVLCEPATRRQTAYRQLHRMLREMPPREQRAILDALAEQLGRVQPQPRLMTESQLAELAGDGVAEIGSHTVNHPVLSKLSIEERRHELKESKRRLEEIVGKAVESFAFPYGQLADYDRETIDLLGESGYQRACSTSARLARPGADPLNLPRFCVRDWDGDEFARQLREWATA